MTKLLLIAAGGGIGTVLRYLIAGWVQRGGNLFPLGTLVVNVLGCFLIGLLARTFAGPAGIRVPEEYRMAIMIGILGGFTTFSTFGLETFDRLVESQYRDTALYVVLSNAVGLAAVWLGDRIAIAIYGV